jgi:hypothetical protein
MREYIRRLRLEIFQRLRYQLCPPLPVGNRSGRHGNDGCIRGRPTRDDLALSRSAKRALAMCAATAVISVQLPAVILFFIKYSPNCS